MRILSKFKDYYDCGAAYGVDPGVVYVREQKEIEIPRGGGFSIPDHCRLLGICGKLIPFVDFRDPGEGREGKKWVLYGEDIWKYGFESKERPIGVPMGHSRAKFHRLVLIENKRKNRWSRWGSAGGQRKHWIKKLEEEANRHWLDLFEEHKTPLWLARFQLMDCVVQLNPSLAEIFFPKFKQARPLFQEIAQFVAELNMQNQIPVVDQSDKTMRDLHRFDGKSFK